MVNIMYYIENYSDIDVVGSTYLKCTISFLCDDNLIKITWKTQFF